MQEQMITSDFLNGYWSPEIRLFRGRKSLGFDDAAAHHLTVVPSSVSAASQRFPDQRTQK
jgi:hypothetical protein